TCSNVSRTYCISHQQTDCHRSDTAWNRRNRAGLFSSFSIVDIADQTGLAAILARNAVDANVDDGCAFLDPVALDHFWTANSSNQNVGGAADRWQILGAAMRDGDGCIGCEKQVCH